MPVPRTTPRTRVGDPALGARTDQLLDHAGKAPREVARMLGIPFVVFSRYIGGRSDPSTEALARAHERLGTSPMGWLLGEGPMLAAERAGELAVEVPGPPRGTTRPPDAPRETARALRLIDHLAAADLAALRRLREMIDQRLASQEPRRGWKAGKRRG